jgi:plasmid stabilization system protein ParE
MALLRSPQADSDLDDIWYYVAARSGSMEIADRLIDSITGRFLLLATFPMRGAPATVICAPACGALPWASISSFTASMARTY